MGKILILYSSDGGNTAKMAEFIAQGASSIPGMEVRVLTVETATEKDLHWCDGIAVGSPTKYGLISSEMKAFWEKHNTEWQLLDGKIGCAFSSQGGWGGGGELACQSITTLLMNFGMLVFGVTDYVAHQFTTHYGAIQSGEPRLEKEIDSCVRLGKRLSEWVAVFVDGDKTQHPLAGNYPRHPEKKVKK